MSYTVINFKSKKALKEAVAKWKEQSLGSYSVRCYQPGLGHDLYNYTGGVSLEGPHYPAAHTWYAVGEMKDGILVKVK